MRNLPLRSRPYGISPFGEEPPPPRARYGLNLLLFLLTVITTIAAGAMQSRGPDAFSSAESLLSGVPFSAALLGILLAHEMGHYLTSRVHGVPASLPYFIPVPSIIGTMGAIIRMRGVIRNRRVLFDIGVAGPLAGIVLAVPVTLIGLHHSHVVQAGAPGGGLELGDSLLFLALTRLVFGPLGPDQTVLLHPVAFAGWLGFLVTSLNLLPMGQLDGGHVCYGMFGHRHRVIARAAYLGLVLWGVHGAVARPGSLVGLWGAAFLVVATSIALLPAAGIRRVRFAALLLLLIGIAEGFVPETVIWLVWSVLICFLRLDHPPTLDPHSELDPARKVLGWIALGLLVLTFTPRPFVQLPP